VVIAKQYVGAALASVVLILAGCNSAARVIRPVMYTDDEDKYNAMTGAPVVVLAEIENVRLISGPRQVEKPPGTPGPQMSTIPLHLAQVSGKVLLTLRGAASDHLQFYAWIWASGTHGGPRLFRPSQGSHHILFLREAGGYLHTVGDYPAYDLVMPADLIQPFLSKWKSDEYGGLDVLERMVTIRMEAELENVQVIPYHSYSPNQVWDLAGITSPLFVAQQLHSYCERFLSPVGRVAACYAAAQDFGGGCTAYRFARDADSGSAETANIETRLRTCGGETALLIQDLRTNNWPLPLPDFGRRRTAERYRLAMRFYASGMDHELQTAACEAAKSMPEARDIPECTPH